MGDTMVELADFSRLAALRHLDATVSVAAVAGRLPRRGTAAAPGRRWSCQKLGAGR